MNRKDQLEQSAQVLQKASERLIDLIEGLPDALAEEQGYDTYPEHRKFGPKAADHHSVGIWCPACKQGFREGDYTTLVSLGPGPDPEARERAAAGRAYNAIAIEIHWACATGEVE